MNRASRAYVYVCVCVRVCVCVCEGVVVAVGDHRGNKGLSDKIYIATRLLWATRPQRRTATRGGRGVKCMWL